MVQSKSTEKLLAVIETIKGLPQDRLKSIAIDWKDIDSMPCPCLFVEFYEGKREDGVDIEISDPTGTLDLDEEDPGYDTFTCA